MKGDRYFLVFSLIVTIFILIQLPGCGGENGSRVAPPTGTTITVSWNPNKEKLVNSPGGWYKLYYSQSAGFNPAAPGATAIDLPYISGSFSPTSKNFTLSKGTWYCKLTAYINLNGVVTSFPSEEKSITVD
jgi:hypothetical protein